MEIDETNSFEVYDALESCKNDAEIEFDNTISDAEKKIKEIIVTAKDKLESAKKNDDSKKDVEKIFQQNADAIRGIEKDTITALNDLHKKSKRKLETTYNSSTTALGYSVRLDNMNVLMDSLDQALIKCTDVIHECAQDGIKSIKPNFKSCKKSEASSSLQ